MLIFFVLSSEEEISVFEYLYTEYKGLMLQKANAILHDLMLAEDAVSEAFIRIYKNMIKIDDPRSNQSIAFVMMIVKNTALTILSKQKKIVNDNSFEEQADSFDLEKYVLSNISQEKVYALLSELNEDLRNVFLLKYAYDLPHKQIGKLLNISENNVTVRIHRAKKKINELFKKEGYAAYAE